MSWAQTTQADHLVIADKFRFYYYNDVTSTITYLVSNSAVHDETEFGTFWRDTTMTVFHQLLRALLKSPNNGGDSALQSQVAGQVRNISRPIIINLWNDSSPFNNTTVRAYNKPCKDSARYIEHCASSWVLAQNTHWSGFMHLGIHHATANGIDWLKEVFTFELPHTLPSNGFRIAPINRERNRIRIIANNVIRSFFRVTGTSVSPANLSFLNSTEFEQRLRNHPDFIREQLVNIFLSHSVNDETINRIKRYYRIISFRPRRTRTFVDEGIQRTYFEMYSTFGAPDRITPSALATQYVSGYTSSNSNRGMRRIIMQEPSNAETLVHEMIHFYTHNNFQNFINEARFQNVYINGISLKQILKEGLTELFAREVMHANYNQLGSISFNAYQPEVKKAMELVFQMGHSRIADAFFRGNNSALTQLGTAISNIRSSTNQRTLRNYLVQLIINRNTEHPISGILRQARIIITNEQTLDQRRIRQLVDRAIQDGHFNVYTGSPGSTNPRRITPSELAEQFLSRMDFN